MKFDLIQGDCIETMTAMPPNSVDIVFTSPPYNLKTRYKTYRDNVEAAAYLEWTYRWCARVSNLLKMDGSFFLNIAGTGSRPMLPHFVATMLTTEIEKSDPLFVLQNTFHWIKSITIDKGGTEVSAGHFKPITSNRYVNDCHEYVFHFTKTGKVPLDRKAVGVGYADKSNIKRWRSSAGSNVRCRGNNWFCPYETIQNRLKQRPHPASFPVELALLGLRIARCSRESTVLDPFVGIGNTGLAAARIPAGKFTGIDIDAAYVAETKARLTY